VGIRLPLSGAIGVAANGVPIYPSFDNADYVVWEVCEGDACSSHSGKGGDYHYHGTGWRHIFYAGLFVYFHIKPLRFFFLLLSGDPYGDLCMYNQSDYGAATDHPPFIGWAADGFLLYGRYTSGLIFLKSSNKHETLRSVVYYYFAIGVHASPDNCGGLLFAFATLGVQMGSDEDLDTCGGHSHGVKCFKLVDPSYYH